MNREEMEWDWLDQSCPKNPVTKQEERNGIYVPVDTFGQHCLHRSRIRHDIGVFHGEHRDEYCCRCGHDRCYNITTDPVDEGHGPFLEQKQKVSNG